jgi:hypothetical protein
MGDLDRDTAEILLSMAMLFHNGTDLLPVGPRNNAQGGAG